jgi:hypothetical protein
VIFEVWESEDGSETSLFETSADAAARRAVTTDIEGRPMRPVCQIIAKTWEAAKEAYFLVMWG